MRYIRFVLTILVTIICLSVYGQTQQGYVKTLGRPNVKGTALSDVIIKIKGEHNPVKSNGDGVFSIQFQNKKIGDAYTMQEVRKVGYELNEPEVIGRQFAVSDKVRNTIVMVSTTQLQADKQRIENNAYKVAEKNYKRKLELLEKEKEDGTITVEKYREQLQELQNRFEKYQSLIDGLAEHYAHTDYDELNEKEREINICIENGNLECADSLIQTLFDPIDVLKRNKEALAKLNEQISQAKGIIDQANADMAAVLKQQEKDAEHLYQLYTIALSRYDNEKAKFYIETRAALDSTNIMWQNDAGLFNNDFTADYKKAIIYFRCGLKYASLTYGEDNRITATFYNNIGAVYAHQGRFQKALELYVKALEIRQQGCDSTDLAASYNNIGGVYADMGNFALAIENYTKGLSLWKSVLGNIHPYVATSYNNLGVAYDKQGLYNEALDCYSKAFGIMKDNPNLRLSSFADLHNNIGQVFYNIGNYKNALIYHAKATEFFLKLYGEMHPNVATSYNNIGLVYEKVGNYEKALQFYGTALNIRKAVLGEEHLDIALSYGNIGNTLSSLSSYNDAELYFTKALELQLRIQGEKHQDIATLYDNIGLLKYREGRMEEALTYYKKALEIQTDVFDKENADIAVTFNNMGAVYDSQGNYDLAIKEYSKSLAIKQNVLNGNHPDVADVYNNLGHTYHNKGDYQNARKNYDKAIGIYKRNYGEEHADVAHVLVNLGKLCNDKHDNDSALYYYNCALTVFEKIYGKDNISTATCYNNIGAVYADMKELSEALEFYEKGLNLRLKLLKPDHLDIASSYDNIGLVYHYQGNLDQALQMYEKALTIRRNVLPEDHVDLAYSYDNIGGIYDNRGDYENALKHYGKALEIWSKRVDDNHSLIALCCYNIALLYINNSRYPEAIGYLERALPGFIHNNGDQCKEVYDINLYLVNAYEQIGEYAKAYKVLDKALTICSETMGTGSSDYKTIIEHKRYLSDRLIVVDKKRMSEYVYVATIIESGTAALQNGLTGDYIVLEYNNWNIGVDTVLYDVIAESVDQPKIIVIMRDNNIKSFYFENSVGASFSLKKVNKNQKKQIIKEYKKWKKHIK